jgi:hypothetical protein
MAAAPTAELRAALSTNLFALRADTDSALVLRALVLVLRAPLETRALARLGLAKHLVAEVANILASFLYV